MRLVGILILLWCFFLPGGPGTARASAQNAKAFHHLVQRLNKAGQGREVSPGHHHQVVSTDAPGEEDSLLVGVDDDDNEEEDIIHRPVLQARDLFAFFCAFILYEDDSRKSGSLACGYPPFVTDSPLYLQQRVLRL